MENKSSMVARSGAHNGEIKMKVGDLVILSDRQSTGLIVERTRNAYWVLVDAHKVPLIESQVWKVVSENR